LSYVKKKFITRHKAKFKATKYVTETRHSYDITDNKMEILKIHPYRKEPDKYEK
jgi:hypothetical protein